MPFGKKKDGKFDFQHDNFYPRIILRVMQIESKDLNDFYFNIWRSSKNQCLDFSSNFLWTHQFQDTLYEPLAMISDDTLYILLRDHVDRNIVWDLNQLWYIKILCLLAVLGEDGDPWDEGKGNVGDSLVMANIYGEIVIIPRIIFP